MIKRLSLVVLFLLILAPCAGAGSLSFGVGFSGSDSLGESDAVQVFSMVEAGRFRSESYFIGSGKIGVDGVARGWIAGSSLDYRYHGGVIFSGVRIQRRDGGEWKKDRLAIRSGLSFDSSESRIQILADHFVMSDDKEYGLEGRAWIPIFGRVSIEPGLRLVSYRQPYKDRMLGSVISFNLWWRMR